MKRWMWTLAALGAIALGAAPTEASAAYRTRISQGAGGPLVRALAIRLYYSNFGRSYIPGTGYGGFARPAFGWRGY